MNGELEALALFGGDPAVSTTPEFRSPFGPDLVDDIGDLLASRPLSSLFGDHDVGQFEVAMAQHLGTPDAVALNSGTSALHAALMALGIGPGDDVAVTCFSFVATASVVVSVGAHPVWVDIDPATLGLDADDLEAKLTPKTRAVIAAHMFGIPADLTRITELCAERGIPLIEDACQALGARYNGQPIGSFGTMGCFSFNVNKIVQTGEGGLVTGLESELLERVRRLRVNGLSPLGVTELGFNYTMSNLQARVGLHQMDRLGTILACRHRWAERIAATADSHGGALTEHRAGIVRSPYSVPFLADVTSIEGRDMVLAALGREGVPVNGTYDVLYHHEGVFGNGSQPPCPTAERLVGRLLTVRLSHTYDARFVEQVCRGLDKVLDRASLLDHYALDEAAQWT